MNQERNGTYGQEEQRGALPFDRHEWAQRGAEAEESLRRQYGREARTRDDD